MKCNIIIIINIFIQNKTDSSAGLSKEWVCSCSLVEIACSYSAAEALKFVSCECACFNVDVFSSILSIAQMCF